ncbi:MAG: hypothetical protein WAU68_08370 [Vitreimonas sp.]
MDAIFDWVGTNIGNPMWQNVVAAYYGLGIDNLLNAGVPSSVLVNINAVGIGLLSAGLTLRNTKLGRAALVGRPLKAKTGARARERSDLRNALFVAMMLFGVFCVVSVLAQLVDRFQHATAANRDTDDLIFASNITTLGMFAALVLFLIRGGPALIGGAGTALPAAATGFTPPPVKRRTTPTSASGSGGENATGVDAQSDGTSEGA